LPAIAKEELVVALMVGVLVTGASAGHRPTAAHVAAPDMETKVSEEALEATVLEDC
jgi:hypothetical protein